MKLTATATSGPVKEETQVSLVYVRSRTPFAIPRASLRSLPTAPDDLLDGNALLLQSTR